MSPYIWTLLRPRTGALRQRLIPPSLSDYHDGAEALDFLWCRGRFHPLEGQPPAFAEPSARQAGPGSAGLEDGLGGRFEFLRERNASDSLKMIPVVVFTSSDEESERLGGNAYVVKPIRYEEFVQAIRSIGVFRAVINRVAPAALGAQTAPIVEAAAA